MAGITISYGLIASLLLLNAERALTANQTNSSIDDERELFNSESGDWEYRTTPTDDEDNFEDYYDYKDIWAPGEDEDIDEGKVPTTETTKEEKEHDEWEGFDGLICGDGVRIGKKKICDGQIDCFDCSDEANCLFASTNVFMCYQEDDPKPKRFTHRNPMCIQFDHFCDGVKDCKNGADEQESGIGFRCEIKNRFKSCILPQRYVCDDTVHCEDSSDMCVESQNEGLFNGEGKGNNTYPNGIRNLETPEGFFHCVHGGLLISDKQVCDGTFDCGDLSDECLCEVGKSDLVEEICGGLCTESLWSNQRYNENCDICDVGEIYWENAASFLPYQQNNDTKRKTCFDPKEIAEGLTSLNSTSAMKSGFEVVECFDELLLKTIRARKCDGRPECFFGEDECGIGCNDETIKGNGVGSGGSGNLNNIASSDPEFCRLLTTNMEGYACLSWMNKDGSRNRNLSLYEIVSPSDFFVAFDSMPRLCFQRYSVDRISVCDGKSDCRDGSDEMFCPKRIPCASNSSSATPATFDEAQRCDGFSHCPNSEDEHPLQCSNSFSTQIPCDVMTDSEMEVGIFPRKNLVDGEPQCKNGADECPPFFSKIKIVTDTVYGDANETQQIGISSHERAIDSMPLQVFLIAVVFLGLTALTISLVLGFNNVTIMWIRFCKTGPRDQKTWIRSCLIYTREIIVNMGFTVSKAMVCSYFAYIRLTRSETINYSVIDLKWRSSLSCNLAGTIALLGTQVPIFTLAFFAISYTILSNICGKRMKHKHTLTQNESVRSEGDASRNYEDIEITSKHRVTYHCVMVVGCVCLIILIWLPVVVLVTQILTPSTLHHQTQTYGWVVSKRAPTFFKANLMSRETAETFAGKLIALDESTTKSKELTSTEFSFYNFANLVNKVSDSFDIEIMGTFGYFAHSGTCLPAFLVHASGGEAPFDIAVSNPYTICLSALIVITDCILVMFAALLTIRYGSGLFEICECEPYYYNIRRRSILNHTFSCFVLIELVTWIVIATFYLLKTAAPDIASDRTYTTTCIVMLGLNCAVATPFVLLRRKFRVGKSTKNTTNRWSRRRPGDDSTRIIEVQETNEERNPLTNEQNTTLDTEPKVAEMQSFLPDKEDSGHDSEIA